MSTTSHRLLPGPLARALSLVGLLVMPCAVATAQTTAGAADDSTWSVTSVEGPVGPGLDVHETVWSTPRPPGGPFDRIAVHRYRARTPATATLLYLPGTNMNGVSTVADERHNLWLFLAARGIEVFALDYRTHFVPPETPASDLAGLRHWTTAVFVDDIRAAADLARRESGRDRLFVGGFSRGVFLAYAYAGIETDRVAGLVLLDGPFKNHAPTAHLDLGAAMARLEADGIWASDIAGSRGWDARQALMAAVLANPEGPATDPKFDTIGAQLAHVLQTAWGPGRLANPEGGLSQPRVLAALLAGYDRYYPTVQEAEGRAFADHGDHPATPLDDRWGSLTMPVVVFAGTGMGGDFLLNSLFSAHRSGSKDVTFHVLERFGHLDVLVGDRARVDVYEPLLEWLRARAGGG
jgi:pimeloyl-ACP methyl ester carboxylesterase